MTKTTTKTTTTMIINITAAARRPCRERGPRASQGRGHLLPQQLRGEAAAGPAAAPLGVACAVAPERVLLRGPSILAARRDAKGRDAGAERRAVPAPGRGLRPAPGHVVDAALGRGVRRGHARGAQPHLPPQRLLVAALARLPADGRGEAGPALPALVRRARVPEQQAARGAGHAPGAREGPGVQRLRRSLVRQLVVPDRLTRGQLGRRVLHQLVVNLVMAPGPDNGG
mmetsp:Transcript_91148/g.258086  ORF Transcript_91148/g.258086 Transcript_91148/m.258086 type:complete len:228 (+) Transcript_91148:253-936(+)